MNTAQKVIVVCGLAALVLFCGLYPPTYVETISIPGANLKYFTEGMNFPVTKYAVGEALARAAFIVAFAVALVIATKTKKVKEE